MKLYSPNDIEQIITWFDHFPSCAKCREVNLDKSSTFVNACAQGSILVMEEMKKRQAPIEAQKAREVEEWAQKAGTFIKQKSKTKTVKYVGEQ